jgi:hypothetical protein
VKYIGEATMQKDRTIVLDLYEPAHARVVYPPSHPEYRKILDHVGGLEPEQHKLVLPWPDEIDDARVQRAVDSYVSSKKGWDKSSYRTSITGTDAEGNIAVTVAHLDDLDARTPGGGKSFALRLSAKDYQVVRELAFQ